MTTTKRLMASLVGAMCASAPPAEGFTPPGCLARVHNAGDVFRASERRLAIAAAESASSDERTPTGTFGVTRRRRKSWAYSRATRTSMSTTPPVTIERYAGPSSPGRSEASSFDDSRDNFPQGVGNSHGTRSSTTSNPLKYFLQDIGKVPLLTQEEEVILGRQVQKGIKLMGMRSHLKLIRGRNPTNEEWAYALGIDAEQLQKELNRTARAKKAMISANLRLVVNIAKRYRYSSLSLMDLIQEGSFGLVRAVERYDPERGFRFSTYAVWWIKQRIGQGANEKSRTVRLPQHVHTFVSQLRRASVQLTDIHGNLPTDKELSTYMETSLYKIQFYRRAARDVLSMEKPRSASTRTSSSSPSECNLGDMIATKVPTPERSSLGFTMKSKVSELLMTLSIREQEVMRARFGLDGMKQRSLEEVGRDFDISRERVRQIEARAMHKLRQPYRNYRVRDFAYGSVQDLSSQRVKSDPASVAAAAATIAEAEAVDRRAKAAYRRAKTDVPPPASDDDDARPETLGVRSEIQSRADKAANLKDQEKDNSPLEAMGNDLGASTDFDVDDADFEACGKWIEGGFNLDDDNFLLTTLNRFDKGSGKRAKKDEESDSGADVRPGAHPGSESESESGSGSKSGADSATDSAYPPANASETLARLRSEMESHPMGLGERSTSDANASSLQLA